MAGVAAAPRGPIGEVERILVRLAELAAEARAALAAGDDGGLERCLETRGALFVRLAERLAELRRAPAPARTVLLLDRAREALDSGRALEDALVRRRDGIQAELARLDAGAAAAAVYGMPAERSRAVDAVR